MKYRMFLLTGLLLACMVTVLAGASVAQAASSHTNAMMKQDQMQGGRDWSDQQFITTMIPRHQKAVKMARLALFSAKHTDIKIFARVLIHAHQTEIKKLMAWKGAWYPADGSMMPDMKSYAMDTTDTVDQTALSQQPFDLQFLNNMYQHDAESAQLAKQAVANAQHPALVDLAGQMENTRAQEMQQMQQWKDQWYGAAQ